MARLPKWDSIYYLIKAASSPDEQISFMAKQLVENWVSHFNSSFVAPTAIQKVNLAMTLDESAGILGKTIQRQIEFMMKGF